MKRLKKAGSAVTSILLLLTCIIPFSAAASQKNERPLDLNPGVQPTLRATTGSSELNAAIALEPDFLRLSPGLREKLSADLAPMMVQAGETDFQFDDSNDAFLRLNQETDAAESAIKVIVQTHGEPSNELVYNAAKRSMHNSKGVQNKDGRILTSITLNSIDGFAAQLKPSEIRSLAARNDVRHISPDRATRSMSADVSLPQETGTESMRKQNSHLTGSGVTIAFLDTGIEANHPSLTNDRGKTRVKASINFVDSEPTTEDLNGHGTAVSGAAAGRLYNGTSGIATNADILNVRVLNSFGEGLVSDAIRGIDWCIAQRNRYNIRVINVSLGADSVGSFLDDPLCQAVEKAIGYGIIVVTSAGNHGVDDLGREVYGSITSPGNDPLAITVGAVNTHGTAQRSDDTVNNFSSRGPTLGYRINSEGKRQYDFVLKPEIVAPGNRLVSAKADDSMLGRWFPELSYGAADDQLQVSGTSIAAGVVSGAAALLVQANRNVTPGLVKAVLQYGAQPINGANVAQQGAGLLNVDSPRSDW